MNKIKALIVNVVPQDHSKCGGGGFVNALANMRRQSVHDYVLAWLAISD